MRRREFLRSFFLLGAGGFFPFSGVKTRGEGYSKPLFVATWKWGKRAVQRAGEVLTAGGSLLDAVEMGVKTAEDDPEVLSVGYGGLPNAEGVVELDAAIMDGSSMRAGAVAGLRNIRNPISVARKVMEHTRHILLVGEGALKFAREYGFQEENLLTDKSRERWLRWREGLSARDNYQSAEEDHDTIGMIGLDGKGNVATACTTSGLAFKVPGRVGDSPLIGHGSYCDSEVGGACATGVGEEVIRIAGSFLVVELMRQGYHPQKACESALKRMLQKSPRKNFQDCFLAVRMDGEIGAASIKPGFIYAVFKNGDVVVKQATSLL